MPDQHREFFALLPYLFTATADERGWPVASVVTGTPGFVTSPDPMTLHVRALLAADDPAAASLRQGGEIGLLGLDLSTRRRNRANGRVAHTDNNGFSVAVTQSFGNCAQYIQVRRPTSRPAGRAPAQAFDGIDGEARRVIAAADTFFVASRSRAELADGGFDVSHRGGRPGFVDVHGDELVVPDFRGNRFFNTLGNLLGDPRAGLLFIDFASGDVLQLQGTVTIDWDERTAAGLTGAQRIWRLRVERGWRRLRAFPFSWQSAEFAPTTLATGTWKTSF